MRCGSSPSGLRIPYSSVKANVMKPISPVAAALREAWIAWRARQQAWRHSCVGRNHGRAPTMTAKLGEYHVGTGDNRLMRCSICSDSPRGIATAAICKTNPRARRTRLAPILTSLWRSVVRLHCAISRGSTSRRPLVGQSVYSRLAGYADTNDADRLARDPAMRLVVSRRASDKQAAARNTVGRFETEILSADDNRAGLAGATGPGRRTVCQLRAEEAVPRRGRVCPSRDP